MLGAILGLAGLLAGFAMLFANTSGVATVLDQSMRRNAIDAMDGIVKTARPILAAAVLVEEAHLAGLAVEAEASDAITAVRDLVVRLDPLAAPWSSSTAAALAVIRADAEQVADHLELGDLADALTIMDSLAGHVSTAAEALFREANDIDTEMALLSDDLGVLLEGTRFMVGLVLPGVGVWLFWVSLSRRQRRETLEAARRTNDAIIASRRSLIASISHELRTPLTSLVGFADELRDRHSELIERERTELCDIIAQQALVADRLAEDLITAARLDAEGLSVQLRPVDLRVTVEAVARSFGWGVRADVQIQVSGEGSATADRHHVSHILRLLLTNAFEHGGEQIVLAITNAADRSIVSVRDNGAGLPVPADRLFTAFETGTSDSGRTKPLGLGLSIARSLARLMSGDIKYHRENGTTSFDLILPAADPTQRPPTPGPHRLPPEPSRHLISDV